MRFKRLVRANHCVFTHRLVIFAILNGLISGSWVGFIAPAEAQTDYCQLTSEAIAQTTALRQEAGSGDRHAQSSYKTQLNQNTEQIRRCRNQSWLKEQAIWLRLYACDIREGSLDEIFDQIVSQGYNQVYLEVFSDGQVLLPAATNRTAWASVVRAPGYENRDLLAEAIAKGHARGLKIYAWMFSLNFGYTYGQRTEQVLAINGHGHTSLAQSTEPETSSTEAFVDPYNLQARKDYYALEQAILQRQPDGVLFDYIRYPRGFGSDSVAGKVGDLWIYGSAAQQALYKRALNQKGLALIQRFLSQGQVTTEDVLEINKLYPQEKAPLWQGRTPPATPVTLGYLQSELWQLSVAHAVQGVLDFLSMALLPVQQRGIPAGAVFFPEANQSVGQQGYDSRLQPWDQFPGTIEWHPMAYATCGNTDCIVSQVQRVVSLAGNSTQIEPAIAGTWGKSLNSRPSLEAQMEAIHQAVPHISSISHFAFSWQEPEFDRDRKFCRL